MGMQQWAGTPNVKNSKRSSSNKKPLTSKLRQKFLVVPFLSQVSSLCLSMVRFSPLVLFVSFPCCCTSFFTSIFTSMKARNAVKRAAATASSSAPPATSNNKRCRTTDDSTATTTSSSKQYYLLKSEPDEFSIDHLASLPLQTSKWDGIRNHQAR